MSLFASKTGKVVLLATGLLVALLFTFLATHLGAPGRGEKTVEFVVRSGWGANAVIHHLAQENLIKSRTAVAWYLRLTGKSGNLKKGIYTLNDGMSAPQIVDILTSGKTKTVTFTIPEGYNNRQIGDLLVAKGLFSSRDEFLKTASDPALLTRNNIPAPTAEGYLFPETYTIPVDYDKVKIVQAMIDEFRERVAKLEGFPTDPLKRHELVILASIVEREAQLKEERALIAGVFHNRLAANYPLESCATIQYLFDKPQKRLYFKDLEIDSPYNTYKHRGLPPGPIANPGLPAIEATLRPEKTNYKFFVVKGDGGHHFSQSYREHLQMKQKYLGGP